MVTRAKASQDRADGRAAPETTSGRASGRPAASGPQTGAWELCRVTGTCLGSVWCYARRSGPRREWEIRLESGATASVRLVWRRAGGGTRDGALDIILVEDSLATLRQRAREAAQ